MNILPTLSVRGLTGRRGCTTARICAGWRQFMLTRCHSSATATTMASQLTDDWTRAVGEPAPGFPSLAGHTLLRNQYARVPDRAFIELAGVDTARYLQGMITNHMPSIENGGEGMLAAFLTPQASGMR